ncbi:hypothetical protein GOP47_0029126 [Adiantum capillus-veneris]|nr:hypothetical protein GOP47_0029126 [Adiantum capillus-veneris]
MASICHSSAIQATQLAMPRASAFGKLRPTSLACTKQASRRSGASSLAKTGSHSRNALKEQEPGASIRCFLSDEDSKLNLWTNSRRHEARLSCSIPVSLQAQRNAPLSNYSFSDLDALKVSQLKQILDLGCVDYRDCLEKRELVERLVDTQEYIPRAAQELLQLYLSGGEPALDSSGLYSKNNSTLQKEEDWWLDAERNTIKVFQEVSPSVVNITTSKEVTLNTIDIPRGTGSGFVWDKEGHIVTNYHVIMNGNRARVTLADTTTWDATVVGVAKNKDLAVIKIAAPASKLKPVSVGTSQALQVGQHVLAIGNPFGLDRTLTSGIISGVGRDIMGVSGRMIRGVIQSDASINPGNSGGPLLDSQGRLIGVNTAIYSPSGASVGVSFAIPVDTVRRVVNEIIRDGKAVRAGLGIICASDSQAKQVGVVGVLVLDVSSGGGAARAGLRGTLRDAAGRIVLGDVIVAINGQTLSAVEDLLAAFDDRQAGEIVRVTVKRGSSVRDCYITLEEINE